MESSLKISVFADSTGEGQKREELAGMDEGDRVGLATSGREFRYFGEGEGTLLRFLEKRHVAIEYQCRSGYCGACRCRLAEGGVKYLTKPLAFVGEGDVLPCCCIPASDIELDI